MYFGFLEFVFGFGDILFVVLKYYNDLPVLSFNFLICYFQNSVLLWDPMTSFLWISYLLCYWLPWSLGFLRFLHILQFLKALIIMYIHNWIYSQSHQEVSTNKHTVYAVIWKAFSRHCEKRKTLMNSQSCFDFLQPNRIIRDHLKSIFKTQISCFFIITEQI